MGRSCSREMPDAEKRRSKNKVPKKSGMKIMIDYVKEYLNGELSRMEFDMDFSYNLMEHYPKMERENAELAECFNYYIAEQGFDKAMGLKNADHKELIRRQFDRFMSIIRDGFY
jgi:hypothetical protein